ncbi:MAG: oligosaccharide flippase family protein, partial [Candidatus Helarchaeota archaeon]
MNEQTKVSADKEAFTVLKGSIILWIGLISRLLITILYAYLIVRIIGPEGYGKVNLILYLINFFHILIIAGLQGSLIKYGSQFRINNQIPELKDLIKKIISFVILSGIIGSIIFVLLANPMGLFIFQNSELINYLYLGSLIVFLMSFEFIFTRIFLLYQKLLLLSVVILLDFCSNLIITYFLVYFFNLEICGILIGRILAYILTNLVVVIIYLWKIKPKLHFNKKLAPKTLKFIPLKELLSFGFPIMLIGFITLLRDIYLMNLINLSISIISVGYYSVSQNIVNIPTQFAISINQSALPSSTKFIDNEKIRRYFSESIKYTSFLLIPLCTTLIILTEPSILLIYGPDFYNSINITQIYLIAIIPLNIFYISNGLLISLKKNWKIFKNIIISVIITVIGCTLTINYLNIYSAVIFIILGNYISTILSYYDLNKIIKNLKFNKLLKIILNSIVSSGITYLFYLYMPLNYFFDQNYLLYLIILSGLNLSIYLCLTIL